MDTGVRTLKYPQMSRSTPYQIFYFGKPLSTSILKYTSGIFRREKIIKSISWSKDPYPIEWGLKCSPLFYQWGTSRKYSKMVVSFQDHGKFQWTTLCSVLKAIDKEYSFFPDPDYKTNLIKIGCKANTLESTQNSIRDILR